MRAFQKLLLPGALLLLAACAAKHPTVLKGDTAFEMQSSILLLAANLPPDRRNEFDRAVETIIFSTTDRRLNENGDRLSPQTIKQLKGRSVAQVIEDAKLLRAVASY